MIGEKKYILFADGRIIHIEKSIKPPANLSELT